MKFTLSGFRSESSCTFFSRKLRLQHTHRGWLDPLSRFTAAEMAQQKTYLVPAKLGFVIVDGSLNINGCLKACPGTFKGNANAIWTQLYATHSYLIVNTEYVLLRSDLLTGVDIRQQQAVAFAVEVFGWVQVGPTTGL